MLLQQRDISGEETSISVYIGSQLTVVVTQKLIKKKRAKRLVSDTNPSYILVMVMVM